MIEAYAFLAVFAAQVLIASVLNPAMIIRYMKSWAARFGSERFAALYPEVNYDQWVSTFSLWFRSVNWVIALGGLLMWAWLFTRASQPDWSEDLLPFIVLFFLLQMSPLLALAAYSVVRYRKVLFQPSQESKRKATLQRRGLFDFVSPLAVALAVLSYLLFVPYAIWLDLRVYENSTLSRECVVTVIGVSLVYALNAFVIYKYLYGRKNPLVTEDGRTHAIGMNVRACVYSCIMAVWFVAIFSTFAKFDLRSWGPFALSAFFVVTSFLSVREMYAGRDKPDTDALRSTP